MSNAKSPVLSTFNGAIGGLGKCTPRSLNILAHSILTVSIRAYGAQNLVRQESLDRIDRYVRSARTFYNLNRWITIRIDLLSALFSASLATYLVYGPRSVNPSNTGFSLNMAGEYICVTVYTTHA
jgi:hypothetical protein